MIIAQNLRKTFGQLCAVNDLNLQVSAAEIYGLVGPDGAGKTTTIRLLCGALGIDSGNVIIGDYKIPGETELARSLIGYMPQRFSLYEELTVIENLRFFAEVRGLTLSDWKPRCLDVLDFVGLKEFIDRRAGHLSGGMKQKLGLAVALVHQPQILLLDEPTTGVDPVTRQDFWQLVIRLVAENNVAVLISTPYMDEAARCTKVGFMQKGRLIIEDSPSDLCSTLENRILELCGEPLSLLRKLAENDSDVEEAQMFGDRIHLRVKKNKSRSVSSRLKKSIPANGGTVTILRTIPPQLENVFSYLLGVN